MDGEQVDGCVKGPSALPRVPTEGRQDRGPGVGGTGVSVCVLVSSEIAFNVIMVMQSARNG